jgi:hypothetical protein
MNKAEKAEKEADRVRAIEELRERLPPGSTIYTLVTHVARSGMVRDVVCLLAEPDGHIWNASWKVATATGHNVHNDGVRVGGCGMDMGFWLAQHLSYVLHGHKDAPLPDGFRHGYTINNRWL